MHADIAIAAAEAREKMFLCEKPLAVPYAESEMLLKKRSAQYRLLNYRRLPSVSLAKQLH